MFIWLSKVITPGEPTTLTLVDDGRTSNVTFWLPDMHAGTMTPIAIASLATLAGLFVVLDARTGDQRLLLAGFRTGPLLGVCIGPIFGRVSGVLIAFLVPFLDVGIAQSPMLRAEPPDWAVLLPGYGADRVLLDGGLTATFDETGPLLLALGWLAALTLVSILLFRRTGNHRTIR